MARQDGKDANDAQRLSPPHVALYMRVNNADLAEDGTLDAQRACLREFARAQNLTVIDEYTDVGMSVLSPLDARPDGRRLLQDATTGRFGCVLVSRVDRLGRSLTALLEAYTALSALGITIRSATEPVDMSTTLGTGLLHVCGSVAELER
jgi:site-specific DNA recombinase